MPRSSHDVLPVVREYARRLPRRPDGRINYASSASAPVLTCFVRFDGKILLLRRSRAIETYPGRWSAVTGFLDQIVPLAQKVEEELREEVGIGRDLIARLIEAEPHEVIDAALGKTWITFPVLADLTRQPEITLDWEHDTATWITPGEIDQFTTLPELAESLRRVLAAELSERTNERETAPYPPSQAAKSSTTRANGARSSRDA